MSSSAQSDGDTCQGFRAAGSDSASAVRQGRARFGTGPRFLTVCAWCDHVKLGRRWLRMEEAVRRLHTFEFAEPPLLTHGICPACLEPLIACRTGPETVPQMHSAA